MTETDYEPDPEFSREDLDRIFQDAIHAVETLHERLTSAAENVGYARQVISGSHPRFIVLFEESEKDPSLYPVIASGLGYLQKATIVYSRLADTLDPIGAELDSVSSTTGTFGGSTDAALDMSKLSSRFEPLPAIRPPKTREECAESLRALDESIGRAYDQVWETFFGTSADPHRAALFMMRQVYDQFFSYLAPDDEVRQSPYWKQKKGDKPNQIFRSERIVYAARNLVDNPELADTLVSSAKQIADLYKAANRAHDRGTLDEDAAEKAIAAMDSMLADWIHATL